MAIDPGKIPLSLYVHWPWCVRKCPYCDFNSRACPKNLPEEAYVGALVEDLRECAAQAQGRRLVSLYLGGGTPSLMQPASVERIIDAASRLVGFEPGAEISMEANPGTGDRFADFRLAGINRVSIGVQSFSDRFLSALGRIHSGRQALQAAESAACSFDNFNLDIMFALPGQTPGDLLSDLRLALGSGATHLSFYQLTLEEGTAFARNPPALPSCDEAAEMLDAVVEAARGGGFERYEVSGYAKKGWRCRHNLNYWTFGDYFGIGAGAHSKLSGRDGVRRASRHRAPADYMARRAGSFSDASRLVAPSEMPFEFMLNVLRLREGVPESLWSERTGLPLSALSGQLDRVRSRGLLATGRFAATALGWDFLSDLQESFLN